LRETFDAEPFSFRDKSVGSLVFWVLITSSELVVHRCRNEHANDRLQPEPWWAFEFHAAEINPLKYVPVVNAKASYLF